MGITKMPAKTPAIGIDLGTTYSCVGVWKNGGVEVIPNEQGNRTTPSYVAFTENGDRLIGDPAKNQVNNNPLNTVCDAKRFIGKKYDDAAVSKDIEILPFKIKQGPEKKILIDVDVDGTSKTFHP